MICWGHVYKVGETVRGRWVSVAGGVITDTKFYDGEQLLRFSKDSWWPADEYEYGEPS